MEHTNTLISRGYPCYSIDGVINKIRWDFDVETVGGGAKINNDFRAYYARLWAIAYPDYAGFYKVRRRTSEDRPAQDNDIEVWNTGPAGDESELTERLRRLLDP